MVRSVWLLGIIGLWLWCTFAIRFLDLGSEAFRITLAGVFAVSVPLAFLLLPNRKKTANWVLGLSILVILAWNQMTPSHDRPWVTSVAVLPEATIDGNRVFVRNIRNFDYRSVSDFTVRYYDKVFDLDKLETVDFVISHWDGLEAIAHVIFSFGFGDQGYLAVSSETRLEHGEPQSGIRGFFNQYELIYVVADEQDLLRLRTNFRKEQVYLYPTTVKQQDVRKLFAVIIERVNRIAAQPEFYNTLTQNCFTSLISDFKKVIEPRKWFDYRRIANGYADQMLYENGWIDTDLSFEEAKRLHRINQYVKDDASETGFSRRLRPYLKQSGNQAFLDYNPHVIRHRGGQWAQKRVKNGFMADQ